MMELTLLRIPMDVCTMAKTRRVVRVIYLTFSAFGMVRSRTWTRAIMAGASQEVKFSLDRTNEKVFWWWISALLRNLTLSCLLVCIKYVAITILVRAGLAKTFILGLIEDKMADAVAPDLRLGSSGIVLRNNPHPPLLELTHNDTIACLRTLLFRFAVESSVMIFSMRLFVSFPIIAHA